MVLEVKALPENGLGGQRTSDSDGPGPLGELISRQRPSARTWTRKVWGFGAIGATTYTPTRFISGGHDQW